MVVDTELALMVLVVKVELVVAEKNIKELTLVVLVILLQHLLLKVQMVVKVMASFSILVVTIDGVEAEAEAVEPLVKLVVDSGPKVLTVVQEHNQT
ncbi:MAG: hypothetical protein CML17_07085 [Pusillimonas sp.]|nr:hypothetical protein [Pusillimonas sp.]